MKFSKGDIVIIPAYKLDVSKDYTGMVVSATDQWVRVLIYEKRGPMQSQKNYIGAAPRDLKLIGREINLFNAHEIHL